MEKLEQKLLPVWNFKIIFEWTVLAIWPPDDLEGQHSV
jgi:hypothetical protein